MEEEERRSKKRMLVMKVSKNDDLQYYGVNSGCCEVAGAVAERKNIVIA